MTDVKDKEMARKAQQFIRNMKANSDDKEMLDYIDYVLTAYSSFKASCEDLEKLNYLEFDHEIKIKFNHIHSFSFVKECLMYPWANIVNIH